MFAGIGSMHALVPPQMMRIDVVGAIAILHEKRSITPWSAASGQGPRSLASSIEAWSTWLRICLKMRRRSEEHTSELQSLMRISYAVFCLKKKINTPYQIKTDIIANNIPDNMTTKEK